jgi:hypothetical protein
MPPSRDEWLTLLEDAARGASLAGDTPRGRAE